MLGSRRQWRTCFTIHYLFCFIHLKQNKRKHQVPCVKSLSALLKARCTKRFHPRRGIGTTFQMWGVEFSVRSVRYFVHIPSWLSNLYLSPKTKMIKRENITASNWSHIWISMETLACVTCYPNIGDPHPLEMAIRWFPSSRGIISLIKTHGILPIRETKHIFFRFSQSMGIISLT